MEDYQAAYEAGMFYYDNHEVLDEHPLFQRYAEILGFKCPMRKSSKVLLSIGESFIDAWALAPFLIKTMKQIVKGGGNQIIFWTP